MTCECALPIWSDVIHTTGDARVTSTHVVITIPNMTITQVTFPRLNPQTFYLWEATSSKFCAGTRILYKLLAPASESFRKRGIDGNRIFVDELFLDYHLQWSISGQQQYQIIVVLFAWVNCHRSTSDVTVTWLTNLIVALGCWIQFTKLEAFLVDADELEMDKTITSGAGLAVITDGFKDTEKELI